MSMPLRSTDDGSQGGMSQIPARDKPVLVKGKSRSWHGVIGTLSIIFGALGLFCWSCNTVGSVITMAGANTVSSQVESANVNSSNVTESGTPNSNGSYVNVYVEDKASGSKYSSDMVEPTPGDIAIAFVSLLLSIMLIVGGIGLVSRKPWSLSILMLFSWLKIITTIIWIILQFASIDDQVAAFTEELRQNMAEQGQAKEAEVITGWMTPVVTVIISLLGLLFIAWPLFLIFFLGRDKIKDDVNGWAGGVQNIDGWNGE